MRRTKGSDRPEKANPTVELPEVIRGNLVELRRHIRRRLGPGLRRRVETEDLVQSALLAAVRDLRRPGEKRTVCRAWLEKVADRRILLAARRHRAQKRDMGRERPLSRPENRPVAQTSPSRAAERAEESRGIRLAIRRLPREHRAVLVLHSLRELPLPEVARRLGLPDRHAARCRFRAALKALGRELSARGG